MFYLIGCKKNFKQYRPNTWLPSLIRYFADIEFNHIIVQDSKKNTFTEAIADGVCITDEETLDLQDELCLYQYVNKIDYNKQVESLVKVIGNGYDFKELLWYQLVWNVTGKQFWGDKDKNDKFICYSLASYVFLNDDYFKVKPKEFLNDFNVVIKGEKDIVKQKMEYIKNEMKTTK